jgi:hypothetical protein
MKPTTLLLAYSGVQGAASISPGSPGFDRGFLCALLPESGLRARETLWQPYSTRVARAQD